MKRPLPLLFVGYGAALAAALGLSAAGAGAAVFIAAFWLGGAVLTLAVAALPRLGARFRTADDRGALEDDLLEYEETARLAEALRAWDEDLDADAPPVRMVRDA